MESTAILMRAVFFLIFIMLWGQIAGAQTAVTSGKIIFTIDVHESGNALWTVEMHRPFTTQSEISEWESAIKNPDNFSYTKDTGFRDRLNNSLRSAENFSNRSMSINNFNVSYDIVKTMPGDLIIRYTFKWDNFSRMNSSNISIGDAFSEELIGRVPSSDNVLVIRIPAGYEVVNATPSADKRDGNRLIWDGTLYRSFSKGEPSLELSRSATATEQELESGSAAMIIITLVILFSSSLFILWIKRRPPGNPGHTVENKANPEPVAEVNGTIGKNDIQADDPENLQEQLDDTDMNIDMTKLSPELTREILSDEEMIEQYLVKFGGQAYQSEIVKESGLSKSKISIVLAKMKEDGRILKIRKGKENIIRIVPKEIRNPKNQTENSGA